jgi:nucleoid-associated protein YgaU
MASGVRAVAKLVILPFKKKVNGKLVLPAGVPFIAPYNPTNFSFSGGNEIVSKYNAGNKPGQIESLYPELKKLSVDLFLDGTGASPPLGLPVGSAFGAAVSGLVASSGADVKAINVEAGARAVASSGAVTAWVNYFFGITANATYPKKTIEAAISGTNKETHSPNFLKIMWGAGLFFNCKLLSATVSYTLFNQLGLPLRATISASFIEVAKDGTHLNQSPDVTKVHIVKAGDTIYNIAQQEYDDESFYIKIAEANDLKNYRRLIPGQELILPPIAKVEE